MRAQRCLVTGGAGFIGSHVAERLVKEGHTVRVVDNLSTGSETNLEHLRGDLELLVGDLRDPATCRAACAGVELVFHLAALPSVPRSMADPWGSHDHNVNGTLQLLLAARDAGVRRVVYSSSSSVYGDTPVLPKVETSEPLPRSPYAAAKLSGEQSVLAYARSGMLEGVALRYFNVFGPYQDPKSEYAAVIPRFVTCALQGTQPTIFGDGEQSRDFCFIDNAVEANLLACTAPGAAGKVFNVACGVRTTLLEVVKTIGKIVGKDVVAKHEPARPGDIKHSLADITAAKTILGYTGGVSFEEGLKRTVEWYRNKQ